jgi:hypothetical protein
MCLRADGWGTFAQSGLAAAVLLYLTELSQLCCVCSTAVSVLLLCPQCQDGARGASARSTQHAATLSLALSAIGRNRPSWCMLMKHATACMQLLAPGVTRASWCDSRGEARSAVCHANAQHRVGKHVHQPAHGVAAASVGLVIQELGWLGCCV